MAIRRREATSAITLSWNIRHAAYALSITMATAPWLADHDLGGVLRAVDLLDPRRPRRVRGRERLAFGVEVVHQRVGGLRHAALLPLVRALAQCRGELRDFLRRHPVHARLGRIL